MADSRRIEELKRRVQQDPASIAFAALAEEYRRAGLFYDAIETCRAGLVRHPAYVSARVTLGRALVEVGEFDEAQTHLEQVLRAAPENLAAIRALADIHEKRGDHPMEAPASVQGAGTPAAAAPAAAPPAPEAPPRVIQMPIAVARLTPESETPAPAAAPKPDPAPAIDPAALRLEAFLAAIQRARTGTGQSLGIR